MQYTILNSAVVHGVTVQLVQFQNGNFAVPMFIEATRRRVHIPGATGLHQSKYLDVAQSMFNFQKHSIATNPKCVIYKTVDVHYFPVSC